MEHLRRFARELIEDGCSHVFGIPGSGPSLTLLDAYEALGGHFVLTHFEGAAAIMAGTMGRLTGRAGACISIKGPGLANMASGLSACMLDGFPVVSIAEAVAPGTPVHAAHKRMDHHRLLSAMTKGSCFLGDNAPSHAVLARAAEAENPGPVHLEICGKPVASSTETAPVSPERFDGDWADCLDRLERSVRPVVIAGTLALRRDLSAFLNSLRIPVLTTAAAKGVADERMAHVAGVYTGAGKDLAPERRLLREADLVVGIGLRHNEVLGGFPLPVEAIQFDVLGACAWSGFGFASAANPDVGGWAELRARLEAKCWGTDLVEGSREDMRVALLREDDMPAQVFSILEGLWRGQARLVMDTGIYCTIGEHVWRASAPDRCLGSGQGRYMGIGLPQAIAAALHDGRPDSPTVLVTGDGGIGMYVAELKTAVARKLPLVVVLLSDGGFGTLRGRCLREGLGQGPLTCAHPSWAAAMEGLGLAAMRLRRPGDLASALPERVDGPVYVEISFEPERYARMTDALR